MPQIICDKSTCEYYENNYCVNTEIEKEFEYITTVRKVVIQSCEKYEEFIVHMQ